MADSVPKDRPFEPVTDPRMNATPLDYKEQFQGAMTSQYVDPCKAAQKASLKCLDRNNYERMPCQGYFEAYRECKKAWVEQRKADRRAGTYKD
ncbi:uncharacterized protein SCHCODRAFT_02618375 [Schizophyllum commune H4-8]|uniref:uncharacterized protein n=1 Tax=Schizophyllum commune (strain H4-8 / FGSC 9210) TaxID=578458 RepID=UPI002160FD3B|nr:uncharacterized protein SCHCODRAFT_02618375 [Schizophyllum commune H4-8]KAI5895019.1 hypothetical protein SCHCODRAFT_02618375 [Schizophyllum commune H4-8]